MKFPEKYRIKVNENHPGHSERGKNGAFLIPAKRGGIKFQVIATNTSGWDHVSVTIKLNGSFIHRCPTWKEMCRIKDFFWNKDEVVIQYHPAEDQYVNNHPYCLHMWKPQGALLPIPPTYMVGIKGMKGKI